MGAKEATATMSRDHVEVDRLTAELGDLLVKVDRSSHHRRADPCHAPDIVRIVRPGEGPFCQGRGDLPAAAGCPPDGEGCRRHVRSHGTCRARGEEQAVEVWFTRKIRLVMR